MALKVRRDDDSGEHPRYLYVSSIGHSGPGPEAPVHVPRWDGDTARLRLTEGELKADVATALSGMLTVSVPGVSAWRGALPVLRHLAPETVILASTPTPWTTHTWPELRRPRPRPLRAKAGRWRSNPGTGHSPRALMTPWWRGCPS